VWRKSWSKQQYCLRINIGLGYGISCDMSFEFGFWDNGFISAIHYPLSTKYKPITMIDLMR